MQVAVDHAKKALLTENIPVCSDCRDLESVLIQIAEELLKIKHGVLMADFKSPDLGNHHSRIRHLMRIVRQNCDDYIDQLDWGLRKVALCRELHQLELAVVRHINYIQQEWK